MTEIQGEQKEVNGGPEDPETSARWEAEKTPGSSAGKVMPVTLMPPDGQCGQNYTESIMKMFMFDAGKHLTPPLLLPTTPMRISLNRNYAVKIFLEESDAEWLLFIDSDMGWPEDALEKLLAAASPEERPVVGALCFGLRKMESDGLGGWRTAPFPTIFDWRTAPGAERPGFMDRPDYSPESVTQCAATGAAFLLIHRSVLERMREELDETWFNRAKMYPDDEEMGEDISFCSRLGMLSIPLFVHTGVRTTHLKSVWVGEPMYQGARVLAALDAQEEVSGESAAH